MPSDSPSGVDPPQGCISKIDAHIIVDARPVRRFETVLGWIGASPQPLFARIRVTRPHTVRE